MSSPSSIPIAAPDMGEPEIEAVARVIRSGWVTQGPEVSAFESEFALACGSTSAVAVSSCTAALHLVLHALGIGPGDEVVTASHSFIATANAIAYTGATPVFVDIRLDDLNLDPDLLEAAITPRTQAILAVHQLGMPCRIAAIADIAARHGLHLVEDAACAIGSEVNTAGIWRTIGQPFGIAACFSFHPRKLLTTGDGGMITTNDPAFATRLRALRQHGMSLTDRQRHMAGSVIFESYDEIGFNYRMTDIQAAIGREQLKRLPLMLQRRRGLAALYQNRLAGIRGLGVPSDRRDTRTNWQSFHVLLPEHIDQHAAMSHLLARGIATRRGVMCAHLEPAYSRHHARHNLQTSERARCHGMILPLFPAMTENDVDRVVSALQEVLTIEEPDAR
ncbi:MAG: DegT/DnrJ/EryC1/StrS family aminotransferase [Gammaproteobacteria bacterium]|nr:DegT/DnrJ/EryC1/StrS family aminotransferase [Gammaproteobacteria bacterium]